jgi:hypothetical protein
MPVNRYDQPIGQRYVSTYVPLPLEEIGQMAKQYSDAYKTGQALPHQLDQLDQALKAAPIHYEKKKALMDKYHKEMNSLVDNAKPEDYAKPEYQQKINNLVYQFKNDPEVNQILNTKQWWDKEYVPYVNNDKNNRSLIYGIHQNPDGSYKQTNQEISKLMTTPYEDRHKAAWDIIGGIEKDGSLKEAGYDFSQPMRVGPGGEYYAYNKITKGWEGVSKGKLGEVVGHSIKSYGDSNAGKHHLQDMLRPYIGDSAYSLDYSTLERKAQEDPNYAQVLGQVNKAFEKHLFDTGFKQIGGKSTFRLDNMTLKDDAQARANKAQEDAVLGLPQTAPDTSSLEDLTKEIPEDLKHIVSYEKQPDGTVKANIDMKAIGKSGEAKAGYGVMGSSQTMGTDSFKGGVDKQGGTITKDTKRLLDYLYNAASAIGIPKSEVTVNKANEILTAYHEYSKNVAPQEILDGPLQKLMSTNIINDRENYTIKDSEGKIVTNEDQSNMKDFKVNSRTYKNGQQVIKGSYFDDGEYKTVTIIPHSNQSNNYFNIVGNIKENVQDFFKTGEVNKDTKEIIIDFESKTGIKFTNSNFKGLEPVSIKSVPGQPYQKIVTMSDKDNRKDIKNYIIDLQTGTKSEIPGGLDGAMQYISTSWYANTPEGKREALQLTNNKGQYEGITEGQ